MRILRANTLRLLRSGVPKDAAYPIAKSIKKKGLQPKSFYNITLKRRRSNMEKQIEKVIFDILNK
jgi:hypothetical protein